MTEDIALYLGDCLVEMGKIPDHSVDAIICDLPYGTTACHWDSVIPLEPLWVHYKRIIKPQGAIVLTASQPFTTTLISSNLPWFRYCWYWEKAKGANVSMANYQPLRVIEEVVVFSPAPAVHVSTGGAMVYHPQKTPRDKPRRFKHNRTANSETSPLHAVRWEEKVYTDMHPRNLIYATTDGDRRVHPTQKPVTLGEYLIKTYTNEGEVVLDNTMGSGSFGVAAVNTGRRFIGIEKDEGYFRIAERRIREAQGRAEQARLF